MAVLAGATVLGAIAGAMALFFVTARAIDIHERSVAERTERKVTEPTGLPVTIQSDTPPQPVPNANTSPAARQVDKPNTSRPEPRKKNPPANKPANQAITVNAPGGVVSLNQQGGITAGTVILRDAPTYRLELLRRNVPDGTRFRTEARLTLKSDATISELRIGIRGRHVVSATVGPLDDHGPMVRQFSHGPGMEDGVYVIHIQNAYRGYTIIVFTSEAEELDFFQVARL